MANANDNDNIVDTITMNNTNDNDCNVKTDDLGLRRPDQCGTDQCGTDPGAKHHT